MIDLRTCRTGGGGGQRLSKLCRGNGDKYHGCGCPEPSAAGSPQALAGRLAGTSTLPPPCNCQHAATHLCIPPEGGIKHLPHLITVQAGGVAHAGGERPGGGVPQVCRGQGQRGAGWVAAHRALGGPCA